MNIEGFYLIENLAEVLELSPNTLKEKARKGEIVAIKYVDTYIVSRKEIKKFLNKYLSCGGSVGHFQKIKDWKRKRDWIKEILERLDVML